MVQLKRPASTSCDVSSTRFLPFPVVPLISASPKYRPVPPLARRSLLPSYPLSPCLVFPLRTSPPSPHPSTLLASSFSLNSSSLSGRLLSQFPPFRYGAYFLIPMYWLRTFSSAIRISAAVNLKECGAVAAYLNLAGIPAIYAEVCTLEVSSSSSPRYHPTPRLL